MSLETQSSVMPTATCATKASSSSSSSTNDTTSLSNDLINKLNKMFSQDMGVASTHSTTTITNGASTTTTTSSNVTKESTSSSLQSRTEHKSQESIEQTNETHRREINCLDNVCWTSNDEEQINKLIEYCRKKLEIENGETIITLGNQEGNGNGINKHEMEQWVNTLMSLQKPLDVTITFLRERKNTKNSSTADETSPTTSTTTTSPGDDTNVKLIREYLMRKNFVSDDFIEVRVAVVGNVDSGKSTLLGVLTHCVLDDGRGVARMKLFRHKHEIETGRTSSVGNDIMGFDAVGNVVNELHANGPKNLDWESICKLSSKVLTFIDLAGHEKYLKTTVFGMTGSAPDFCMLMIGSNMGIIGMTKEHLGLSLALNVPVFVVLTKIDMCPPNILQDTLNILLKILKSPGCRKLPYLVENHDDVVTCALNFTSERLCPIFQVSNVTGKNLDLLKSFLNLLNSRMEIHPSGPCEFQIDDLYSVPGVGTVVSGTCYKGRIQLNDTLLLGPDLIGQFRPVIIKGIHRKRLPVKEVRSGQTASFALKKIKRSELRKGMVLVSDKADAIASWVFEAEILVLHHPTTISVNYQAMIHCNSIRQTATILDMSLQHMRTGDKATCKFAFIKNPEFLRVGSKMIFREGRTKAVGTITKINLPIPQPTKK